MFGKLFEARRLRKDTETFFHALLRSMPKEFIYSSWTSYCHEFDRVKLNFEGDNKSAAAIAFDMICVVLPQAISGMSEAQRLECLACIEKNNDGLDCAGIGRNFYGVLVDVGVAENNGFLRAGSADLITSEIIGALRGLEFPQRSAARIVNALNVGKHNG